MGVCVGACVHMSVRCLYIGVCVCFIPPPLPSSVLVSKSDSLRSDYRLGEQSRFPPLEFYSSGLKMARRSRGFTSLRYSKTIPASYPPTSPGSTQLASPHTLLPYQAKT